MYSLRSLTFGLVLAGCALPALAATSYVTDAARSSLEFTATQTGAKFGGKFGKFTARIVFADEDLAHSSFDVQVDVKSLNTGDEERDATMRGADLFAVDRFPQARFLSTGFTRKAAGQYEAVGKLTIRDVTREIHLPFTFQSTQEGGKPVATLQGGLTLNRLDYGVGQGEWQDTTWVADPVEVKFSLRLLPGAAAAAPTVKIPAPPARDKAK